MLFAAKFVTYAHLNDGELGSVSSTHPGPKGLARTEEYLALLGSDSAFAETDGGFCVRVRFRGETIGVLGALEMAFPQYSQDYLNLTMAIVSLCGLAISNAATETRRRQAEAQLSAKSAELERSNEELAHFAHVASHDLQAPLHIITSFLQLLQKRYGGQLDATANEFIGFAVDGAEQMKQLINDVLAYARVGTQDRSQEAVEVQLVLDTVLQNLSVAVSEAEAKVTWDPLPRVWGDRSQLVQLLQNLVGNALKYRGEAPPEVHLRARREGDRWRISISDNGIGLKMKHAEQIFVVFNRLHSRDEFEGSGIGLATCKRILDNHGGKIWVESTEGEGSTFHFTLRAADDAEQASG